MAGTFNLDLLRQRYKEFGLWETIRRGIRSIYFKGFYEKIYVPIVLSIDPTILAPAGFSSKRRADRIYGDAFRTGFEYLAGTNVKGAVMEFGSYRGYTSRWLATLMREFSHRGDIYIYDSFEGLPEITSSVDKVGYEVKDNLWFKGQTNSGQRTAELIRRALSRKVPAERVHVVKGFFEDTLGSNIPKTKAALVHIDCDLYSSTKTVLDGLIKNEVFQDGTVIFFDDYNCNHANPELGERKAVAEAFGGQDRYSYSLWFAYGWEGQAVFVHDKKAVK